ncbi:delta-60 repeat domain-containing protein [Pseudomonas eucalypticola]|uniref:Delta-60 repeat domain-containing protein n=1 Tax=Pseudomonas eucalypticola TaxID=2599595 RepID=A0A7D5DA04_9PSED|nr:delta-60 repeat domain-containing protein [Pseudomonas eucalypticola]QKZ06620.1 delta-60 repeat domain-containing protein [Pseudomonas eucalypticola]
MYSRFTPHHERPTSFSTPQAQSLDEQRLEIDGDIKAMVQLPSQNQWLLAIDSGYEFCVARLNADLTLDRSFGAPGAGYFYDSFEPACAGLNVVNQIAWLNGKIVVVGAFFDFDVDRVAIARYHPDGSPDLSFNGTGKRVVQLPHSPRRPGGLRNGKLHSAISTPHTPLLEADGCLWVFFHEVDEHHREGRSLLLRLTADGALDPGFNHQGFAPVQFEGRDVVPRGVVRQGSALLVYGATCADADGTSLGLVARFNAGGERDMTFNGNGFVVIGDAGVAAMISQVHMLGNGEFLAVGTFGSDLLLSRRSADGSPASQFNDGVPLLANLPFQVSAVKALIGNGDGVLLAASIGAIGSRGMLIQLRGDGSLDTDFGAGAGYLMAEHESEYLALGIERSGAIVAAGYLFQSAYYAWLRTFDSTDRGTLTSEPPVSFDSIRL